MSPSRALAALAIVFTASALYWGCSDEKKADCERDNQCSAATTGCTIGVCRDGKCVGDPAPDGTRVPDQSSVKDELCVMLACQKGVPTKVADGSKTGPDVACKKSVCEGMTLKTEDILDGVPCNSGEGACRGGVCVPNEDAGPGPDTGTPDTGGEDAPTD